MDIQTGDMVRTKSGEVGRVVHTSRLTVFVALPTASGDDTVRGYLESDLNQIESHEYDPNADPRD